MDRWRDVLKENTRHSNSVPRKTKQSIIGSEYEMKIGRKWIISSMPYLCAAKGDDVPLFVMFAIKAPSARLTDRASAFTVYNALFPYLPSRTSSIFSRDSPKAMPPTVQSLSPPRTHSDLSQDILVQTQIVELCSFWHKWPKLYHGSLSVSQANVPEHLRAIRVSPTTLETFRSVGKTAQPSSRETMREKLAIQILTRSNHKQPPPHPPMLKASIQKEK